MQFSVIDKNKKTHIITIDNELSWLSDYIKEAKKLNIPVWRISKIKGYYIPKGKIEIRQATTYKRGNEKVIITILKKRQVLSGNNDGKIRFIDYTNSDEKANFEFTLNSLAHELAHLIEWKHTANRFILESKLMCKFAKLAKQKGYIGY